MHNEYVAEKVAENDFEVGHFGCTGNHARHGDECDAREGGANHANGYYPPR